MDTKIKGLIRSIIPTRSSSTDALVLVILGEQAAKKQRNVNKNAPKICLSYSLKHFNFFAPVSRLFQMS